MKFGLITGGDAPASHERQKAGGLVGTAAVVTDDILARAVVAGR